MESKPTKGSPGQITCTAAADVSIVCWCYPTDERKFRVSGFRSTRCQGDTIVLQEQYVPWSPQRVLRRSPVKSYNNICLPIAGTVYHFQALPDDGPLQEALADSVHAIFIKMRLPRLVRCQKFCSLQCLLWLSVLFTCSQSDTQHWRVVQAGD